MPQIFTHPVDTTDRFRGSGQLHSQRAAPGAELSDYIVVNLDQGWGFCNRVHTLMTALGFGSMHGFGIYIYWQPNDACPGDLSDVVHVRD